MRDNLARSMNSIRPSANPDAPTLENVSRSIGRQYDHTPDGDELWRVLLVVAVFQIRRNTPNHPAAERQLQRAISSARVQNRLESHEVAQEFSDAYLESVLEEILELLPPQNRVMVALRLDGCEVAEVARLTGRSTRSVERILNESRLKLISLLKNGG
jgi:RNA polymerase sigma-70 factor, ECF subfamily